MPVSQLFRPVVLPVLESKPNDALWKWWVWTFCMLGFLIFSFMHHINILQYTNIYLHCHHVLHAASYFYPSPMLYNVCPSLLPCVDVFAPFHLCWALHKVYQSMSPLWASLFFFPYYYALARQKTYELDNYYLIIFHFNLGAMFNHSVGLTTPVNGSQPHTLANLFEVCLKWE